MAAKTAEAPVKRTPIEKLERFLSHISEATVWIIVLLIVLIARYFTVDLFDDETTIWIVGLILSFALAYYTLVYNYFSTHQRRYIKDLADVIFIGILGTVAQDYSVYFFSLYILPIAAAAFALDILNSLVVATVASVFIAGNIILNTRFFDAAEPLYFGTYQIILLIILTFFTRALALQLRKEQEERHFFEGKLRQVDQKLNDIEAIEQEFVSITTHQLNTPLSIIRGYTSMLMAGDAGKLSAKQQEYIDEVHGGTLRLTKIIKDLLAITRLDRDKYLQNTHQPVDVNDVISQAIGRNQDKAIKHNIVIAQNTTKERMIIMGNSTHFEEALSNIIDNALKYSNDKTKIDIRLTRDKGPTGYDAVISIADEGIGIPTDEQQRIFQRFYRASNGRTRDTQGTGLGLYVVKRIVEFHGGSISFKSHPGEGTTFSLRFPLVSLKEPRKEDSKKLSG